MGGKNKRRMLMKKILVLVSGESGFNRARQLVEGLTVDGAKFYFAALDGLTFYVDRTDTFVRDERQNFDIADFDLVIFRTISKEKELAVAASVYLGMNNKPYIDKRIHMVSGRRSSAMLRAANNISIPATLFGDIDGVLGNVERIGFPVIMKATNSRKGRDNYLVKGEKELEDILRFNKDKVFVVQKYIENDGDYRVLIAEDNLAVSFRRKKEGTHLNNLAAGASEEPISDLESVKDIVDLARVAGDESGLSLAGVDVIVDKNTSIPYVLEVNRAPQMATEAKYKIVSELIKKYLQG